MTSPPAEGVIVCAMAATIEPVAARAARGREARAAVTRRTHGAWAPSASRPDPVELLLEQASARVPELVPIRHGRMLVSPFAYFRGAARVMAADLAGTRATGLGVQLCGDAHLTNFGGFAAPDRRLVFSVNDFDETLPGPFEWDVKRLVASFAVAGRENRIGERDRRRIELTAAHAYRETVARSATLRTMDVWYARMELDDVGRQWSDAATVKRRRRFERNVAKARTRDSLRAFAKLTERVDGRVRIASDPPLIVPIEQAAGDEEPARVEAFVNAVLRSYRRTLAQDRLRLFDRFSYVHSARKVVGVGSVGTRAWIVLMIGRDENDPLVLQIKEAQTSVLEPFLPATRFANQGQRVVEGQRMMQAASDVLLGWFRATGPDGVERDYYVRQLWDAKGSAIVEAMDARAMEFYAEVCGSTLARAHARSGDAVAIAGYLGRGDAFDRSMASFAEAYADQNDRDYAAFERAVAGGRLTAEPGR